MPTFKCRLIDDEGHIRTVSVVGVNKNDAISKVESTNLTVIKAKEVRTSSFGIGRGIGARKLILFFVVMEEMERVGIPMIEIIDDMKANNEERKIRDICNQIYESLKNGSMLSEALAEHPSVFDKSIVSLIYFGEKTGNLSAALKDIVRYLKWMISIRAKLRKTIVGSSFSALLIFSIMIVSATVIVPKITQFSVSQGFGIPLPTRALISFSTFVRTSLIFWIMALIGVYIIYKIIKSRSSALAFFVDEIKLRVPMLGTVISKLDIARFVNLFSVCYNSGIDIPRSLEISSEIIRNAAIRYQIQSIIQKVKDGHSLNESLSTLTHIPQTVKKMFASSEKTGNMGNALDNVRAFYEEDSNRILDNVIASTKPMILILTGGMVLWMAIGSMAPIYSSIYQMQT